MRLVLLDDTGSPVAEVDSVERFDLLALAAQLRRARADPGAGGGGVRGRPRRALAYLKDTASPGSAAKQ